MPARKKTESTTPVATANEPWIADALRDLPALCTTMEAARALRMSTRHLRRQIDLGRIWSLRSTESGSSRVLVPRAEIGRYLESLVRP